MKNKSIARQSKLSIELFNPKLLKEKELYAIEGGEDIYTDEDLPAQEDFEEISLDEFEKLI